MHGVGGARNGFPTTPPIASGIAPYSLARTVTERLRVWKLTFQYISGRSVQRSRDLQAIERRQSLANNDKALQSIAGHESASDSGPSSCRHHLNGGISVSVVVLMDSLSAPKSQRQDSKHLAPEILVQQHRSRLLLREQLVDDVHGGA